MEVVRKSMVVFRNEEEEMYGEVEREMDIVDGVGVKTSNKRVTVNRKTECKGLFFLF